MKISNFIRKFIVSAVILIPATMLSGCFDDDDTDYTDWRARNLNYIDSLAHLKENGVDIYTRYVPVWEPGTYVLMKWHNDRNLTKGNPSPWSTSTVDVKYKGTTAYGLPFDSSYNQTRYGDSIYRTTPAANVTGFHAALVNMHVGDSVTVVIPYQAGYGSTGSGAILPFSTLIFDIKLKAINALEVPGN